MCYLRQVKLEQQNRIYSNEALSDEKPRVLGTLVDLPLVADPSLDTDPPLDARCSTLAVVATYDQEGSLWRPSNLCSSF